MPSEAYFETTIVLVSGGSLEVAIPQLEPITLPNFQIALSADKKGAFDEYVPLTVSFSFDSSLAQTEKIVLINSGADSMRDLFLDVGSHYAWPIGETLIENVEASSNELRIHVGSL